MRAEASAPAGAAAALRGRRPDYRPLFAALDIPALVGAGTEDPCSNAGGDSRDRGQPEAA